MNIIRKLNKKIQMTLITESSNLCEWIGKKYDVEVMRLMAKMLKDDEVLDICEQMCDEASFFPMSLLPKNFKKNRQLSKRLSQAMMRADHRDFSCLNVTHSSLGNLSQSRLVCSRLNLN